MDLEQTRELMHRLNSGVGKATSITAWETRLTETDTPDGELLDVRVDLVDERELPLGHVGSASPCCGAPGDEHEADCVMFGRGDDAHPWEDLERP